MRIWSLRPSQFTSWRLFPAILFALATVGLTGCPTAGTSSSKTGDTIKILNVSYDPTRELWKDLNQAFVPAYAKETGTLLQIGQSHGASGSQARAIIDGLEADVATLSIKSDVDAIRKKGLIKENWESTFPNNSLPYTSTVVFVVRKGNPRRIKDWKDLTKGDIQIITASPKTSGNGKLSFLAAWGTVLADGGTRDEAIRFVKEIYRRVPVLDTGARGATSTFAQKKIGDVHLALESEAWLEVQESKGELEIVYPPQSIVHEPHIAIVDANVDRRQIRPHVEAYLNFLYSPEGQEIIARHHFRPTDPAVVARHADRFPAMNMFSITDLAADWDDAHKQFFAENGLFDQIYVDLRK